MADWLEGKKTIITGLIVAVLSALSGLGVTLPPIFGQATEAVIMTALGVLVVVFRLIAKPKV